MGQPWHGSHLGRFHTLSGQDFNRRFPALGEALVEELADSLTQSEYENKRLIREAIDRHYGDRIARTELDAQRVWQAWPIRWLICTPIGTRCRRSNRWGVG